MARVVAVDLFRHAAQRANAGGIYTPLVTTYSYDVLGNLTGVNQAGDSSQPARVRSFTYDSLSRLLTSTNPESGKTTYAYNGDGSLISKTDARGITINYASIDSLHRVLQKTYSNGDPAVTFTYDQGANANGRLSSETVGSVSRSFAYDPLGRVVTQTDCLPSGCHTTSVPNTGYDLASELTSLVYPDGGNVTTAFNTAGRVIGVNLAAFNGTTENVNYYAVPQTTSPATWGYFPAGAMNRGTYGNGLLETIGYNNRLQINSMTDVEGTSTLFSKSYGYYDASGHNNGNVLSITDGLNSAKNQIYSYDQLNRLLTASESDNAFNVSYNIDPFGNMKESGTSNFTQNFDSNNRMAGWSYDAAGNLLNDGSHTYTYDAECRVKTVDGAATNTYGPDGERVRKDTQAGSTEYIYFGGSVIAELNPASGAWTDYIFAGGSRIAKDTSANASGAQYYQGDHLGSTRMMTDATGMVISSCSYAPYGEQVACSPDNASNHYRFTGKERDTETNLDYFGARYESSALGRFLTPDWLDIPGSVPYADFEFPQSLNLYSYVRNNPISNADPDGHDCVVQSRTGTNTENVSVSSGTCDGVKVGDGQSATYVPGTTDISRIHAGADGRSIDIGYTPYEGGGTGVFNAEAAQIPGNTNLAYNWGNNAQGYRTLAQAGKTVNAIAIATGIVSGANLASMAAGAVGQTGMTTIAGEDGVNLLGNQAINRMIGTAQRELLKDFFKSGKLPEGLSQKTLRLYKEIAQRAIAAGKDQLGVQAQRIEMINNALH